MIHGDLEQVEAIEMGARPLSDGGTVTDADTRETLRHCPGLRVSRTVGLRRCRIPLVGSNRGLVSRQTPGRNAGFLDPKRDPAKVRAMYTHPVHARQGIGRLILTLCEAAAKAEGFLRVELMATMAGEPLYRACGYQPIEQVHDERGGVPVPLVRMQKEL